MASAPPNDDDLFDLDFTSPDALAPATPTEPAKAPAKESTPLALEPLEFAVPAEALAPVVDTPLPTLPATALKTPLALEPIEVAMPAAEDSLDFCASLSNALTVSSLALEPVELPAPAAAAAPADPLTQAALIAAEGHYTAAGEAIAHAIMAGLPREREEFAWRMLFELDLRLNNRPMFEQRALDFAALFEKSPPVWTGDEPQLPNGKPANKGAAMISLSGPLRKRASPAIEQMVEVAKKRPVIHLDLTRLREVDDDGCGLLLNGLRAIKKLGRECQVEGAEHTIALAQTKLALGQAENENIWLLVLELLQRCGENERFDDWAVNYAVTFEVSPPAYEAPAVPSTNAAETAERNATNGWPLSGDWIGEDDEAFAPLESALAKGASIAAIDASRLCRLDLGSAQALGRVLKKLNEAGTRLNVRHVGYLHQPVLELAGVSQHAQVELHK